MTVGEKLQEQFGCAISAILGDLEDEEWDDENNKVDREDLLAMARKVCFYLDK